MNHIARAQRASNMAAELAQHERAAATEEAGNVDASGDG
jgi:hypothetical protein